MAVKSTKQQDYITWTDVTFSHQKPLLSRKQKSFQAIVNQPYFFGIHNGMDKKIIDRSDRLIDELAYKMFRGEL